MKTVASTLTAAGQCRDQLRDHRFDRLHRFHLASRQPDVGEPVDAQSDEDDQGDATDAAFARALIRFITL